MKILDVTQGSPEWAAIRASHFCASEASAMLGCNIHGITRNDLLRMKATGDEREFSDWMRKHVLDKGHEIEAATRTSAEYQIGDELFPATITDEVDGLPLLASFDGLTMSGEIAWECKTLNADLSDQIDRNELHPHYWAQLEQQLLVSGAQKVYFTASDGRTIKGLWYESRPERRAQLIAGWKLFAEDLAAYVPAEVIPAAVAAPQMALPAVSVQITGSIAVIDNLTLFGDALTAYVERINKQPATDQDFADLEATVKTLKTAEEALSAAEQSAIAQTGDLDSLRRTVALYRDLARSNRLTVEKLVKAEKENRRNAIIQRGKDAFSAHIAAANKRIGKPWMPAIATDFPGCVRSLKSIASIENAVDTELARAKIEASAAEARIVENMATLRDLGKDHAYLFADAGNLITKANDDLILLIKARISEHEAAELKRIEVERERIRSEEEAKATAKMRAEEAERERQRDAEADRINTEAKRLMDAERKVAEIAAHTDSTNLPPSEIKASNAQISPIRTRAAENKQRPNDAEIIGVLALHYRVHESKVIEWLLDVDLDAASRDMLTEFAA